MMFPTSAHATGPNLPISTAKNPLDLTFNQCQEEAAKQASEQPMAHEQALGAKPEDQDLRGRGRSRSNIWGARGGSRGRGCGKGRGQ